jgi:HK97 family phage major capsid protein/HK97 family phage prohead protease
MLNRAFAVLEVKADQATRTIRGIASTPTPDRHGDVLEPSGATFSNPIPLLFHHDRERPVGTAILTATPEAITFEASLPVLEAPGALRDRVEEAWQLITAGLMRGASIGFRPIGDAVAFLKTGGVHFLKTEIVELSLVTIPANLEATILTIKALEAPFLPPVRPTAAVPVVRLKGATSMKQTTQEQITAYENTRAASEARMRTLMTTAAEDGRTLDGDETVEYDGLDERVKGIDAHLVRLRALERAGAAAAVPIPSGPAARAFPVVTLKSSLPPGTAMTRAAMALLFKNGNRMEAVEYAKQMWDSSTPEVALYLKAAIAPGTTTDPTWAGPLVPAVQNVAGEFIDLLRPATILGKIPNLRVVPFNTSVPAQTAGGSYGWVGQGKPKPVTKLAFAPIKLEMSKSAGLIILTEELVRLSSPSAELLARQDMIKGISGFLDQQFIDPAVAYVANVNPASITNGITPIVASTPVDPLKDIQKLLGALAAAGVSLGGVVIIMSETNALALGFARDALGNRLFPGVGVTGGTVEGITVITSNRAGSNIIAFQPDTILYADDGSVSIDVSREASVEMSSTPMSPSDATTVLVSLWQNNLVGLRAERYINWKRGLDAAVAFVSGATYTPAEA